VPYLNQRAYLGALIGRYANRIAGARFVLDRRSYALAANDPPHHLHGGTRGFNAHVWHASVVDNGAHPVLELARVSDDQEEGYPGQLSVRVRYTLSSANALRIDYAAETDAPTIVNLTQHSYFNLSIDRGGDVLQHLLTLHADSYTPVGADLVPTGEIAAVAGTPFDFREASPIGRRIAANDPQLAVAGGYDHNWVLRGPAGVLRPAATLHDPVSGRTVEVATTEPGLQFYSGNFLDGTIAGRGVRYTHRSGLCLETQHFPDSPHHLHFPSTVLRPDAIFRSTTVFTFSS
jgi:aldose 1-epimerase